MRITHLQGYEHPSWLGMEGIVSFISPSGSHTIRFLLNNGETTSLIWDTEYLESVDQDHAEAIRVLGEDYFA